MASVDALPTAAATTEPLEKPALEGDPSLDLAGLVAAIDAALCGECDKEADLKALLSRYNPDSGDWRRYKLFDPCKKYTRNLIADDEKFTLMLLCWNPAKYSPVHDHPCDGCWMKCIEGCVEEVRYKTDVSDGPLEETSRTVARAGDVVYIDDAIALHKVGNPGPEGAVTLHLYSPPFSTCRVWLDESLGGEVLEPVVTYYSEHGVRVEYD